MEIRKDAFFAALVALGLAAPACGGNSEAPPADDSYDTSTGDEYTDTSPTTVDDSDDVGGEYEPAPVDEAGYEEEEYAPVTE